MQTLSAVALFCDDVREEKAGTTTVVGILPDNVSVKSVPVSFPKLGLYVRINFPTAAEPPQNLSIRLTVRGSPDHVLTEIDSKLIDDARRQSREKGATLAGLVTFAVMSPFQVKEAQRIDAKIKIGDEELVCGTLNVQIAAS